MSAPLLTPEEPSRQTQWSRFRLLWNDIVGYGLSKQKEMVAVLQLYEEGDRHYHTIDHVMYCLRKAREFFMDDEDYDFNPLEQKVVELALVFHDISYDVTATNNEERSAAYARTSCRIMGYSEEFGEKVARAILDTKTHLPVDEYGAFVCDADLAILAEPGREYEMYMEGLRKEYSVYTDLEWYGGRIAFLEKMLKRPRFFFLDTNEKLNGVARQNMEAELELLQRLQEEASPDPVQ
jgi:predicted metal-dependent HD superfamily phosphohydrolase